MSKKTHKYTVGSHIEPDILYFLLKYLQYAVLCKNSN
jgi:hypothetical protein